MMWPNMCSTPFSNREVAAKFKAYPPQIRRKLMTLRELIVTIATKPSRANVLLA